MSVTIQFIGAARTVTGSQYLIESDSDRILVDAGLFQGDRDLREGNWRPPPYAPADLTAVVLTHAHIDHTGLLPRIAARGLNCPVYCSDATRALSGILLPDSARLHEEEARFRGQAESRSRHHPPLPLYTEEQALACLKRFVSVPFAKRTPVGKRAAITLRRMGHILGAASVELEVGGKRITFSGDIGRYKTPILCDPEPAPLADLLLIESTYSTSNHPDADCKAGLARVIQSATKRGGTVLIPSFAVGRTQQLLYLIRELKEERLISSDLPIVVDSPMATDATELYRRFTAEYDTEAMRILAAGRSPFSCSKLYFTQSVAESKKLNTIDHPMVLIAASGMLTGGRILHHLLHRVGDPRTTILFVGFQPPGGRGAWIQSNPETMRLFGQDVPVRARWEEISALSAHADKDELLRWCRESSDLSPPPGQVAVVHGEGPRALAFADTLSTTFGWTAKAPMLGERWTI